MKRHKRNVLIIFILFLFAGLFSFIIPNRMFSNVNVTRRADMKRFKTENYKGAFLAFYPIDTYSEEDFVTYRGMDIMLGQYCFEDERDMVSFIKKALKGKASVDVMYLGLDPSITESTKVQRYDIVALMGMNPEITFEVLLPYPTLEEWVELSDREMKKAIKEYYSLTSALSNLKNVNIYYLGSEEWLIGNQDNYIGKNRTIEMVSKVIMLNTFCDRNYQLNTENMDEKFDMLLSLREREKINPTVFRNDSDLSIVFLGDSFIGNYSGNLSIPGVVHNFTKAKVYNCGYGGTTASLGTDSPVSLPGMADALITGDLSILPEKEQAYQGIEEFRRQEPKELCFIINYGFNDYTKGHPVCNENPFDITSFEGAIRVGIHKLQEAYPEAPIIMMTPPFTIYFSNGTEKVSEQGGVLTDYVDAVLELSDEMSVYYINNYKDLGIHEKNWETYLSDGCHLNELGRYYVGKEIARTLNEIR